MCELSIGSCLADSSKPWTSVGLPMKNVQGGQEFKDESAVKRFK